MVVHQTFNLKAVVQFHDTLNCFKHAFYSPWSSGFRICDFHSQGRGSIPRGEATKFFNLEIAQLVERSTVMDTCNRLVAGSNPAFEKNSYSSVGRALV